MLEGCQRSETLVKLVTCFTIIMLINIMNGMKENECKKEQKGIT